MTIDFTTNRQIFWQLLGRICGDVIKGKLGPGDRLPSVRKFAVESGVNVNTVQRVYKNLVLMNLTETKRGLGTFITTDTSIINNVREQMKQQVAAQFVTSIQTLGFSVEEIIDVMKMH